MAEMLGELAARNEIDAVFCADVVVAASTMVAAAVVPMVLTSSTPYVLDNKWPVLGGCALVAGLALVVRFAAGGRLAPKTAAVARFLGLFLCAAALSVVMSKYRGAGIRETWWYAAGAILFMGTAVAFRRGRWVWWLVGAMLLGATIAALSGYLQWFRTDLPWPWGARNWTKGAGEIRLGDGARVFGTIGLETELGGYMATGAVLAVGAALAAGWRTELRILCAVALYALAALMIACMAFSGTRSACAAFLAGLVALAVGCWRRRWAPTLPRLRVLLVGCAAALVVAWWVHFGTMALWHASEPPVQVESVAAGMQDQAPPAAQPRHAEPRPDIWRLAWDRVRNLPKDFDLRWTIWQAAIGAFESSPVVGMGPGTFGAYFAEFRPRDYARHDVSSVTSQAHNEYLELLAETGLLGVVPFAIFIGLLGVGTWRALRSGESGGHALLPGAFAAAVTMLLHAGVNVDTRFPTGKMTMWLMLGLVAALWGDAEPMPRPLGAARAQALRWAMVLAAAVLAAAVWRNEVWGPYEARVELRSAEDAGTHRHYASAAEHSARAVELDPISVPSHYSLANARFHLHDYEGALAALRALKEHSPHFADADLREGVVLTRLGRMTDARAAFGVARRYGVATADFWDFESLPDEELGERAKTFEFYDSPW